MSIYVNNTFRVKRSFYQEEDMRKLQAVPIFDYKDILMISAMIGYNEKRYVPIEKRGSDGVLMQFFSQRDYDIMDLIAYAHKKEQSIIKSDEKYEIFSSYANGGFPILLEKLKVNDLDNIDSNASKQIIRRYYMLLLSDGFKLDGVNSEDLII